MAIFEKHRSNIDDYIYKQYDENLNFNTHFHNSFEYIYVNSGKIIVTIETKDFLLSSGESILILPNQLHSYKTIDLSKTSIIIFANNYVAKFYKKSLEYKSIDPRFEKAIDINIDLLFTTKNTYLLKSMLYYLIYLYTSKPQEKRDNNYNEFIQKIIDYIENNYDKELSLEKMALDLNYDYHYLSNVINENLKCNFLTYVNEIRINRFCELLKDNPSTPIFDLANACGFKSLRSFNRNFKEYKGTTPTEYKKSSI